MSRHVHLSRRTCRALLVLAGALLPSEGARAQPSIIRAASLEREPLLGRHYAAFASEHSAPEAPAGNALRFRMFGMMPGFLTDPPLPPGADPLPALSPAHGAGTGGSAPGWIQVIVRDDNPFFDLRRPDDPGGVGFYRLHSQLQLLESGTTSVCFNLQAVAPAGPEAGGVQDGPTVLTPGLALFQELGGGAALQGFVGQHIWAGGPVDPPGQAVQYGMGVQCPVPGMAGRDQGLYLFLQALGRYQYEGERPGGRAVTWDFVPGVHWRVNEKCWLSLGASRTSLLTCSWQF